MNKKPTAGQPTKYRPEFPEMLLLHMDQGFSFESFAGIVRVHRDTLYAWVDSIPEFAEAKAVGRELSRLWWEAKAIRHIVSTKELGTLNAILWNKNVECRFPEQWRQTSEAPTVTQISDSDKVEIKEFMDKTKEFMERRK